MENTSVSAARPGRPRSAQSSAPPVRALSRGLTTLEQLARTEAGLSLSVMSKQMDLPPSTTHRILETLCSCGFVSHDLETGVYRLGVKTLEVGSAYLTGQPLHVVARPIMKRLVKQIDENTNLAIRDQQEVVYILQIEGQQTVRMFTRIGARSPLHCTGVGKTLLAWLPAEQVCTILGDGPLSIETDSTICDLSQYMTELELVRKQGYAIDNEERESGVRCVAAPVFNQHGQVVASVSTSAPTDRMPMKLMRQTRSKQIMEVGAQISQQLGYGG